jgi:hypothetical protein
MQQNSRWPNSAHAGHSNVKRPINKLERGIYYGHAHRSALVYALLIIGDAESGP